MDGDMKHIYLLRRIFDRLMYTFGGMLIGTMIIIIAIKSARTSVQLSNLIFIVSTIMIIMVFISAIMEFIIGRIIAHRKD